MDAADTPEKKKSSSFVASAIAILLKGSKLLKFLKVAKPLVLFLSMAVSAIAYTFLMGPWLAILFVLLLLIHEMGHVIAMRMKGFDTPTPVFIPFLGAAIFAPKFNERDTEAFIGIAGPLLGSIASLIMFGAWYLIPTETAWRPVVLVASYMGIYLNLFNLIPISPLDGGRVTQAAGGWFRYVGLFLLAGFSIWFRDPVILYVWILVLLDLTMIPVRPRSLTMIVAWIAMVTLMSLGYSDQPTWVNVVDCTITLVFVVIAVRRATGKLEDAEPDEREALSAPRRIGWFIAYFTLAASLSALVVYQHHLLPVLK